MRQMMGRLKLTVNKGTARICRLPDGEFDFLGYTFVGVILPRLGGRLSPLVHRGRV